MISAPPLPIQYIWDIATLPGDDNTLIVVMSGFGSPHVWRGKVQANGTAIWTDISGTGAGRLPDIPVNVLVVDPTLPGTMYIGTDIAVFRTTNSGETWTPFSSGLPNCAIFDMSLHVPTRLLRVATHGRGMWERKLDAQSMPDVSLFIRHNLMDTGRSPSPQAGVTAAFEDSLNYVALGEQLSWWECADIKIDALEDAPTAYQMDTSKVDYVAFERTLQYRNPRRGSVNRVYAQVHNRGIATASNVTVKILYTDAAAGLPDLPSDFWTTFPGASTDTSRWKPIGPAKVIPSLLPIEPAVLEWDWSTPMTAPDHPCLLMIADSASDPIPPANKVFNINALVSNEKRVGVKNFHVVNAAPGSTYWIPFNFFGNPAMNYTITFPPSAAPGWRYGLIFPAGSQRALKLDQVVSTRPSSAMLQALTARIGAGESAKYDTTALYTADNPAAGTQIANVTLPQGELSVMLLLLPPPTATAAGKMSILQEVNGVVVGGSTFILRTI